jgi:hypothetical protein
MYFVTPTKSVALNAKAASTSLAKAIISTFYPEKRFVGFAFHLFCPKEAKPTRPVILVIRDPVSRFAAAMSQVRRRDAFATLDDLEHGALAKDPHFRHQHPLLSSGDAFALENVDAAAAAIGLPTPLEIVNEAVREKPELTDEQQARVLAYYAEDAALYAEARHA